MAHDPARSAVLALGLRTPQAKAGGVFARENAAHLGAVVAREALARSGVAPSDVDEVIVGCVGPPHDQANVARVVWSISDRIAPSACPTGVCSPVSRRPLSGSPGSSNVWITSSSVSRRALPTNR